MFRTYLAPDECMVFVYAYPAIRSFRMKDTLIPLSIAFLDARFQVISIRTLRARDDSVVTSDAPALYVLEANAGWFARANVRPGDTLVPGLP